MLLELVNISNSLPDSVVLGNVWNTFKNELDNLWQKPRGKKRL